MTTDAAGPDDRFLVEGFLRTRSEAAFLALYDRHTGALYRFASRLSGSSGHEPADLVQEAWLRALEGLPGFRWGSSLSTWLCGIVLNGWREQRRRAARAQEFTVIEGVRAPQPPPSAVTIPLERALAALPEGYREVLLLHDLEGHESSWILDGRRRSGGGIDVRGGLRARFATGRTGRRRGRDRFEGGIVRGGADHSGDRHGIQIRAVPVRGCLLPIPGRGTNGGSRP